MTATECRDATWSEIRDRMTGMRMRVYNALLEHGPCTTLALAAAAEMSGWSVRPRITELCQMGLVRPCGRRKNGHRTEGMYEAVPLSEAEVLHERMRVEKRQLFLKIREA